MAAGNVWSVAAGLAALATDRSLAIGLVANLNVHEGGAMSPEAAVVSLAVVLCIVGCDHLPKVLGDLGKAALLG